MTKIVTATTRKFLARESKTLMLAVAPFEFEKYIPLGRIQVAENIAGR
jgi:hypothetical protein